MWEMEVDATWIRRMENMSDMLDRLGLARADCSGRGSAPVFGSAVRVCESCAAGDVCHDWLKRAAKTLYRAPDFCPNADRFAQLLAEQAGTREETSSRVQPATKSKEFWENRAQVLRAGGELRRPRHCPRAGDNGSELFGQCRRRVYRDEA
jgi:Family of unknown function (DUF6455)